MTSIAPNDPSNNDLMLRLQRVLDVIQDHAKADDARAKETTEAIAVMNTSIRELRDAVNALTREHNELENRTLKVETAQTIDLATRAAEGTVIKTQLARQQLDSMSDQTTVATETKLAEVRTEEKKTQTKSELAVQIVKTVLAIVLLLLGGAGANSLRQPADQTPNAVSVPGM